MRVGFDPLRQAGYLVIALQLVAVWLGGPWTAGVSTFFACAIAMALAEPESCDVAIWVLMLNVAELHSAEERAAR